MRKRILIISVIAILLSMFLWGSCNIKEAENDASKLQKGTLFAENLTCEYRINPLGINVTQPRLGWYLSTNNLELRDQKQSAYHILVASNTEKLDQNQGDLWDSEKTESIQQHQIKYQGKSLTSGERIYWKVRIWDQEGNVSDWSEPAFWEAGLLKQEDWGRARWIALEVLKDSQQIVPGLHHSMEKGLPRDKLPIFRKEFNVSRSLERATLFISGLGQYEALLNATKVGDFFLDPGWTNYRKTCLYTSYDVTDMLKQGPNVLSIMLGNGMFFIPGERYSKHVIAFGYPQMILKLILRSANGQTEEIVSDTSFKVTEGPVVFTSIFGGEDYDARKVPVGWLRPGFDDSNWQNALAVKGPGGFLRAQSAPPLKIMETFKPIRMIQPVQGIWVYDMGQNASGIPEITVTGQSGSTVKIVPGELIDSTGLVTQKATGSPCYFSYTLSGNGIETWHPLFTYYGFRYLQVENAVPDGEDNPNNLPTLTSIKTLHTRNSADRVGAFSCSNDLFNRIYKLIDWAIKSNMASVITDCPHREKLGWLEQDHLMGASIRYNYNIHLLFKKIIRDMQEAQLDNGLIPDIAPEYPVFTGGFRDSPEWGSAFIILPWYLYQWYGDQEPLKENYYDMKRYVSYLQNTAENNIVSHGLGDWYDIGPKPPSRAQLTPISLTATAMYYYDISILEKAATLLGKDDDIQTYHQLAASVKQAFNERFFNHETKQYATGSQTANAMALYMDLVEPAFRQQVLEKLVANIRARGNRLTAGDIGFRYLMRVLQKGGCSDVIFDMNSRTDVPGYGFQLSRGATALTESWQAYRNVSNNHLMLGHIMEWFYSGLAGIQIDLSASGYDKIIIKPAIVGDITRVKGAYESVFGRIVSSWQLEEGKLHLNVTIPPNTTATVYVPTNDAAAVMESGSKISQSKGIELVRFEKGRAVYHVESGSFSFQSIL